LIASQSLAQVDELSQELPLEQQSPPSQSAAGPSRPTIFGIQLLRALAATAVVVTHVQYDFIHHLSLPDALPNALAYGNAGVDLFFVISGFVMVYSSDALFGRKGAPFRFFLRRIARIVPLYWLMTTVMLAYVAARGFAASDASPKLAVASYFFLPLARPSGEVDALYGVGWTLNYEMFFYFVFAVALIARRGIAVTAIAGLFAALVAIETAFRNLPMPLAYWASPLILEFVLGMAVALLYRAGVRLSPAAAALVLGAAVGELAWCVSPWGIELPRVISCGAPAALGVAALALVGRPIALPGVTLLGDASYALYLIHPAVIAIARILAERGLFAPAAAPWRYLTATVAACIGMSILIHRHVEKPLTQGCRRLLLWAARSEARA
jgi:exopolysaccharide production protein ExoZ